MLLALQGIAFSKGLPQAVQMSMCGSKTGVSVTVNADAHDDAGSHAKLWPRAHTQAWRNMRNASSMLMVKSAALAGEIWHRGNACLLDGASAECSVACKLFDWQ